MPQWISSKYHLWLGLIGEFRRRVQGRTRKHAAGRDDRGLQPGYTSLKLLQLRYLIAIADNGVNITTAANRLHTSQPGVSKQLRMLEEELGVQLFVRHGKSLTAVTPAGQHIIDHARLIMREVDDIRAVARGFIDEGQADLDEPVHNKLPAVAARTPSTHSLTRTLGKRPF